MILKGERVYLRPLTPKDAEGSYPKWLNDEDVCRYNSHGSVVYTKEMALEYIDKITDNPLYAVFAVCLIENNRHIGNISLQQISKENKNAEFAILMGEKTQWGKGYAYEASKLLFNYGFGRLDLHRIYCGTSQANIAMQHLAISLGMKLEGIKKEAMRKNDKFYDILEYGILKKDLT
jgi:RimJ/RimL family protein N-acetyltransferase